MNHYKCIILFLFAAILLAPSVSSAKPVNVNATGEYIMGDNDTFTEGKKLALQDAKRLVLEQVGTYIESTTEVKNGAVSSDEIKQYAAGIIKVDVVDEQRSILASKASVVKVTVKALVDPDDVVRQVMSLQNRKEAEEKAKKLSLENDTLRNEITFLNQQLRLIKDAKQDKRLRDQRDAALQKILDNEQGLTMLVSGESLVKASLFHRQQKQGEKQLIKRFLREVAEAYQVTSEEPEVEDNGDGTSNVIIRYQLQLPGKFDLRRSNINVSSNDEFLSKGFVIKAFSNGGLIIRCADYGANKCNTTLSPYFDSEASKMHISIKLGEYTQNESLGIMESSDPSKRRPTSTYVAPPRSNVPIPRPSIPTPARPSTFSQPSRFHSEGTSTTFQNNDPSRIYYPMIHNGSYTCIFKKIPHSALQRVSKIEIKVVDK
jgi:hypothetical protein